MCKISEKVKEYLSLPGKINVVSTSNKAGENNIAMFGSVMSAEDDSIILMLGNNKTYSNLKENPCAALLIIIPGETGVKTQGCRIYLKVRSIEDRGETFEGILTKLRDRVGDSADMLKHLVTFDVVGTRPVVDMGQGI